jgi:hypothetical protein
MPSRQDLALVQGWPETRATLAAWNRAPMAVLPSWLALSFAISALLLVAVATVGVIVEPDPTPILLAGVHMEGTMDHVWSIFGRNLLVLALHAMACVAGFIAKTSLPREAEAYRGWWRTVHDKAGPAAIAFVAGATLFSLSTQSYALGSRLSTLSWQLDTSPPALLLGLLPHAIPELVAIFLPLAAWLVAARAQAWSQLLAATLATTVIALPVLLTAAVVEVYVTPELPGPLQFV